MKLLRNLLLALSFIGLVASATAQNMPGGSAAAGSAAPTANSPAAPRMDPALGAAIKAIVDANRDAMKVMLAQRKTLLDQLKNATPEQKDAIKTQLQQLMKDTQAAQRDLAKAIRDAIKARRDAAKPSGG